MKTLRMTILSLSALILFLAPSQTQAGTRDVRVRARVSTPYVRVDFNHGQQYDGSHYRQMRNNRHFSNLSKQDRKMARRLAEYTGHSSYRIMMLRDRGYRWSEIAYRLDLPRQVVRAARSARSWNKFMKPVHWCGTRSH